MTPTGKHVAAVGANDTGTELCQPLETVEQGHADVSSRHVPPALGPGATATHRAATCLYLGSFLIMALHLAYYGDWIVDDAAITFAYARSLVEGHGFVAAPGAGPVEGFSNLLWLLLLALPMALDVFDPIWTPKLIATLLCWITLHVTHRTIMRAAVPYAAAAAVATTLLALTPGYAIWAASGLENSLYGLWIAVLLNRAVASTVRVGPLDAVVVGCVVWLAAMTRPEGVVFAALWPATVIVAAALPRSRRWLEAGKCLLVAGILTAGFLVWRVSTFGDIVPNTFHAKFDGDWLRPIEAAGVAIAILCVHFVAAVRIVRSGWRFVFVGTAVAFVLAWAGPKELTRALVGDLGVPLLALAHASASLRSGDAVPWIVAALSATFAQQALPPDWMGEHRFGTPFLVVSLSWLCLETAHLLKCLEGSRWRTIFAVVISLVTVLAIVRNARSAYRFRAAPTLSMQRVGGAYELLERWALEACPGDPSILVPDVGGALWNRSAAVKIHDLGGLCDKAIAPLLGRHPAKLASLVLEELRPVIITFHDRWTLDVGLHGDDRFRLLYAPIVEYVDVHASARLGEEVRCGIYVRRDCIPSDEVIARWRRESSP